ncbi:hypothetical protein LSH36_274g00048 [Paralvinella palmiformis]|uniref:Uncharacterized protein n=1 Tax=Paralvinella palmiformis TaxID=53620 RepID=A0AAD9N408_9ANNE|nr:hypothetical protein LSH36_274g00048 [Paralvinella palmiformis]
MEQNGPQEPEQNDSEERTKKKVLMLGLGGSGKSSILQAIQMNHMKVADGEMTPEPTEGFHSHPCTILLSVGGSEKMRKYWADFIQDCDILVYVVDAASDGESLKLAGEELQHILDDPGLDSVPLILLANKQDLNDAQKPHDVLEALHLKPESLENRLVHEIGTEVRHDNEAIGLGSFETILAEL